MLSAGPVRVVVVAGWLMAAATARAPLDAAREDYQAGRLKAALSRLAAVEALPDLSDDDRADLYWMQGAASLAMGQRAQADRAFDQLARLRPLYAPDPTQANPVVRAAWATRLQAYQAAEGVGVEDVTVAPPRVLVRLNGKQGRAAQVVVFARAGGTVSFREFTAPRSDAPETELLLRDEYLWREVDGAGTLELVVEARHASGTPLARAGNAVNPILRPLTHDELASALTAPAQPEPAPPPAPPPAASVPGPASAAMPGPAATPQHRSGAVAPTEASPWPRRLPVLAVAVGMLSAALASAGVVAGAAGFAALASGEFLRTRLILEAQETRGPLKQQAQWQAYHQATLLSALAAASMAGLAVLVFLLASAGGGVALVVAALTR